MQSMKRTRYFTGNSWNQCSSLAYNMKIRNVVDRDLQGAVYDILDTEDFYCIINELVEDFDRDCDWQWQAGFNGRSGGWLVLYKGGYRVNNIYPEEGYKKEGEMQYSDLAGWLYKEEAEDKGLLDFKWMRPYSTIASVKERDVPGDVKRRFRKLAETIVRETENLARNFNVEVETEYVPKEVKVLKPKE